MEYCYLQSPIGQLLIAAEAGKLCEIGFPQGKMARRAQPDWQAVDAKDSAVLSQAVSQLDAYFAGRLREFDLPLSPAVTQFQSTVLSALQNVPYGQTVSYGDLAQTIGKPKASRAVGMANGRNPIPIVIPCHRVIGANGSLTGFGGGVPTKRWLLALEQGEQPTALYS